jgi:hypothetical protein
VAGQPRVRLYNLAGELLGHTVASISSGEIRLDLSGAAAGVYVVLFEYETPSGTRLRRMLKAAVF